LVVKIIIIICDAFVTQTVKYSCSVFIAISYFSIQF